MKKILALTALLAILLVTACAKIPDRGIVTAHDYDPRWMQMICSMYDKNGLCQVYTPIWHPERWNILIDPDTNDEGGEAWVSYREDVFATYPIGSVWINPNPEA